MTFLLKLRSLQRCFVSFRSFDKSNLTQASFASSPAPYSASDWLIITNGGNEHRPIGGRAVESLAENKKRTLTELYRKQIFVGHVTQQRVFWWCGAERDQDQESPVPKDSAGSGDLVWSLQMSTFLVCPTTEQDVNMTTSVLPSPFQRH